MDTHPSLGMHTTAGSLALLGSKPKQNSAVVEMVLFHHPMLLVVYICADSFSEASECWCNYNRENKLIRMLQTSSIVVGIFNKTDFRIWQELNYIKYYTSCQKISSILNTG